MNEAALKYKIYKILLESNASKDQRDLMVELGIVDTIKSMFKGAGKSAGKAFAALKDDVAQEKLAAAQKNISAALDDLKGIAKKAGKDDAFVNALLQQLLQSSGADPKAVASASPEKAAGGDEGKGAASPGTPVTIQTVSQNPQLQTVLVAAATGKPTDQVASQIAQKKPDATAITKLVSRAASKATGVKDDVVDKVIQILFDAGKLKLESKKSKKKQTIVEQTNEVFASWQRLAGISNKNRNFLFEAELERDAKSVLPKLEAAVENDPKNKEMLTKLLDDIKNDKKPDERSYKTLRNILMNNKDVKDDAKVFFSDVEDTIKSTLGKGLESEKEKTASLEKELGVKASEIQKHKAEAEELSKKLEQDKTAQKEFIKNLSAALKIDPSEFRKKLSDVGFEGLIAAAMAKKPEAVEQAADKAGVEVQQPGDAKGKEGEADKGSSELSKVVRGKIKPEELSDEDLNKVVNWVEEFLDKAAKKAASVEKESK